MSSSRVQSRCLRLELPPSSLELYYGTRCARSFHICFKNENFYFLSYTFTANASRSFNRLIVLQSVTHIMCEKSHATLHHDVYNFMRISKKNLKNNMTFLSQKLVCLLSIVIFFTPLFIISLNYNIIKWMLFIRIPCQISQYLIVQNLSPVIRKI